jgi:hypothetical protein
VIATRHYCPSRNSSQADPATTMGRRRCWGHNDGPSSWPSPARRQGRHPRLAPHASREPHPPQPWHLGRERQPAHLHIAPARAGTSSHRAGFTVPECRGWPVSEGPAGGSWTSRPTRSRSGGRHGPWRCEAGRRGRPAIGTSAGQSLQPQRCDDVAVVTATSSHSCGSGASREPARLSRAVGVRAGAGGGGQVRGGAERSAVVSR